MNSKDNTHTPAIKDWKETTPISDEMVRIFFKAYGYPIDVSLSLMIDNWEAFKAKHSAEGRGWEIIEHGSVVKDGYATGNIYIRSVRRLSDGLIFSIGDTVLTEFWQTQIITGFLIQGDEMVVEFETCRNPLTTLKKAPIPEQKAETKPPLGIMPEWLWKEKRLQDIRDAIERYLEVNQPIPVNWIAEEYAIRGWLENHQVEIKQKIKGE
jgi:hypothetical protein